MQAQVRILGKHNIAGMLCDVLMLRMETWLFPYTEESTAIVR